MTPEELASGVCGAVRETFPGVHKLVVDAINKAVAAEREACAAVAHGFEESILLPCLLAHAIGDAISERGTVPAPVQEPLASKPVDR